MSRAKKSLEKSKLSSENKKDKFTIIAINFVQEQLKNIAERIPETTRRRKSPILMTKQLEQLL